jgi:hypothetical protein
MDSGRTTRKGLSTATTLMARPWPVWTRPGALLRASIRRCSKRRDPVSRARIRWALRSPRSRPIGRRHRRTPTEAVAPAQPRPARRRELCGDQHAPSSDPGAGPRTDELFPSPSPSSLPRFRAGSLAASICTVPNSSPYRCRRSPYYSENGRLKRKAPASAGAFGTLRSASTSHTSGLDLRLRG